MTDSTDNDDASSKKLITTRGILKGIGVTGGVAALGAGGIFAIIEHTEYKGIVNEGSREPEPPEKNPPDTQPEDTSAPRTTPWDTETVVVSINWKDGLGGQETRSTRFGEAIAFWNDYIEANVQFDLTLTFEPGYSDPDILFEERSIMNCFGEYDSPATNDDLLTPLVCLETLRETPAGTPVTAAIGTGLNGDAFYGLLVKHALGRLIGFDIWTEPVDVMTPKILFGPAHADQPMARTILSTPGRAAGSLEQLHENADRSLSEIHGNPSISSTLESVKGDFIVYVEDHEEEMREWESEPEEFGFPRYLDAYEATVKNDEIAYIKETTRLMTELAQNNSDEEIEGSDELATIVERLEDIRTWSSTKEEWDVQIHRAWTDAVWSDWTDE